MKNVLYILFICIVMIGFTYLTHSDMSAQKKPIVPTWDKGDSKYVKYIWKDRFWACYEVEGCRFYVYSTPSSDQVVHSPICKNKFHTENKK